LNGLRGRRWTEIYRSLTSGIVLLADLIERADRDLVSIVANKKLSAVYETAKIVKNITVVLRAYCKVEFVLVFSLLVYQR